ncbi:MAG: signal recognition particle subunit SRP19/SEC65 family protein, partial [Candidatus Thermoplasmatota archaeon]|nr:signal recognition particle subunit SRP19/SEC65 family protein [Candidatus Thermoplasmatota archaeon]
MVSRNENKIVIYPIYFDKTISRISGRKVSLKNAVEKPNIEEIYKAAKSLGLNPVLEKEVSHPFHSWRKDGRILVDKKDS